VQRRRKNWWFLCHSLGGAPFQIEVVKWGHLPPPRNYLYHGAGSFIACQPNIEAPPLNKFWSKR